MDSMEIDPIWQLVDPLTLQEAAALVAGFDPNAVSFNINNNKHSTTSDTETINSRSNRKLETTLAALLNPIKAGTLKAQQIKDGYRLEPNWAESLIFVEDLKAWLESKNFRVGFFFQTTKASADYLNPDNPRYAPKLAAAVEAWLAVTDPGNKSPKQALSKWLREHALDFNLTDEDGKPNETGIEEAAKVANWQLSGGAPKSTGT